MLKKIFTILAIVGVLLICVLAFVPSMSIMGFDKPLWLCIIIGGSFIYLMILLAIYDKLKEKIA